MRMSLAWKATTLILLNVVLTFTAGILARNYVLNPELAKVERLNDQKTLHQLGILENLIKSSMLESVNRLQSIAKRIDSNHWEQFATAVQQLDAASDLSYVIVANDATDIVQVRPGPYFDMSDLPTPDEINQILTAMRSQAEFPALNLLETDGGPVIFAGDTIVQPNPYRPAVFIAVSRIDEPFIQRVSTYSGVDITLVNHDEFNALTEEPRALSGLRSESARLHWSVDDSSGNAIVMTEIGLPPRSYDDRLMPPTLFIALLCTLAMWGIAIWLLYRTTIRPMNVASSTLRTIMENRDYEQRLHYQHRDEFGRLITFFNRLLGMVDRHTSELETLSLTDPLTGLGNRRAFDHQSQRFWSLAERTQSRMALIAFDIDYFKRYNDTYGHPAGDQVIKEFARILVETFKRASDVVARVGGEEFLVLTHDTPTGSCQILANRVLQDLRKLRLEHTMAPKGIVTACFTRHPMPTCRWKLPYRESMRFCTPPRRLDAIAPCTVMRWSTIFSRQRWQTL